MEMFYSLQYICMSEFMNTECGSEKDSHIEKSYFHDTKEEINWIWLKFTIMEYTIGWLQDSSMFIMQKYKYTI